MADKIPEWEKIRIRGCSKQREEQKKKIAELKREALNERQSRKTKETN